MSAPPTDQLALLLDELAAWASAHDGGAVETFRYGPHADQELDLRLPAGPGPHPVAIVVHGGFWRGGYTRGNTQALAVALTRAGWATANVEYRRLGPGEWRSMHEDVAAARARLDELGAPLDLGRTLAIGHSAGGQLALWLGARGAVSAAVALAGVADLDAAARAGLGSRAVQELLGGEPHEVPEAYAATDPAALLPHGVPQLLVHGTEDDRVPVSLSRSYAERARAAGDDCRVLELPGAGHFDPIDPRSPHWPAVESAVAELLP